MRQKIFTETNISPEAIQRLRELLHYNPETGIFTWKSPNGKRVVVGSVAGHIEMSRGYIEIGVDGRKYRAHRLAWLYVTGCLPDAPIDHIDGDKRNNAWKNLRIATASSNRMNSAKLAANNTSGYTGVYWDPKRKRWKAALRCNGAFVHIAYTKTAEEAARRRQEAERIYFGEFAPTRELISPESKSNQIPTNGPLHSM